VIDSFYLAWKYITYNKARTATLVACVTLIAVLPLALELLLAESERQLMSRANRTPLVLGAKGSSLDLVMSTLYFSDEVPELISMAVTEEVMASNLAAPVPMYVRFQARGFPLVGTTLDYFDFRGLEMAEGRSLALLGECVVGAAVAETLGLAPGDTLLSSPETVFDLAGVYPLKMHVVGVLARTHTSDDVGVFVDVKTAWVIQGLVHGHEDVAQMTDPSLVMNRSEDKVAVTAKLAQYTQITPENIDTFHFHGDPEDYPITAVIALPHDERSATILRGRYIGAEGRQQIVRPKGVIEALLENIFRIRNVLDAVILVVGLATLLALILVFALSWRLREREINTIFKLGCSRLTIARLFAAEIVIIGAISGLVCAAALVGVSQSSDELVRALFVR
jgi:putative ABC transport system permease protein